MPRTKGLKKDRIKSRQSFLKNVADFLTQNKGRLVSQEDQFAPEYELDTPAGLLHIHVYADIDGAVWIAQKFDDVERAKAFAGNFGDMFNRHSGKWNFHWGDHDPATVADPEMLVWYSGQVSWLLSQPPAPAPTERFEVVRKDTGAVLVNRCTSMDDAGKWLTAFVTKFDGVAMYPDDWPRTADGYECRKSPNPADAGIYRFRAFLPSNYDPVKVERAKQSQK